MNPLYNLNQWISENRHLLKPPVSNKVIWKNQDFIVMVVGGPNARTDFHVNQGDEFFYQIEGQMHLKLHLNGRIFRQNIQAGEIYLLPGNTPHSPQREAGSVGLVIERRRQADERDGLQWYCEACHHKLYEEFFKLENIETQFPAVFERFYTSSQTQCSNCGHHNQRQWSSKLIEEICPA